MLEIHWITVRLLVILLSSRVVILLSGYYEDEGSDSIVYVELNKCYLTLMSFYYVVVCVL